MCWDIQCSERGMGLCQIRYEHLLQGSASLRRFSAGKMQWSVEAQH